LVLIGPKENGVRPVIGKDLKEETGMKRGRSGSTTLAQRIPLGPGRGQVAPPVANAVNATRVPISRVRAPAATAPKRASRIIASQIREEIAEVDPQSEMEIESERDAREYDEDLIANEREVETMIGVDDSETEDEQEEIARPAPTVNSRPIRHWPALDTERADRYRREVDAIREAYEDQADIYDLTMVSEYSEEIFEYMSQLEVSSCIAGRGRF
jgi:hypothetical protein